MRWIPFIASISVIFLLGTDSSSETQSQNIEMLQFRSQIAPNMEPISASLQGADQFEVDWRLQESSPRNLFIATDNTAFYQSNNQWKSVPCKTGERMPVKQTAKLPEPAITPISLNLKITESSLSVLDNHEALWTYSLPGTNQIRPNSLQYDAAEHISSG